MNAFHRRYVNDTARLTSVALDHLRLVEERQALTNKPRLVREGEQSADYVRDHWRQKIFWQGVAIWSEDPALMVEAIREVMALRPEHSRWRLQKLCELWAQIGGPDWPTLGPPNGPWAASLKNMSHTAA
jgi:hypothetical protein